MLTGSRAMAPAIAGSAWGNRLRENSWTFPSFMNAKSRIPSILRSKIHSGPSNRSYVSVAAIGSIHSGNAAIEWFIKGT